MLGHFAGLFVEPYFHRRFFIQGDFFGSKIRLNKQKNGRSMIDLPLAHLTQDKLVCLFRFGFLWFIDPLPDERELVKLWNKNVFTRRTKRHCPDWYLVIGVHGKSVADAARPAVAFHSGCPVKEFVGGRYPAEG